MVILFISILIVILALFLIFIIYSFYWPHIIGRVIKKDIISKFYRDTYVYSLVIEYEYSVNGKTYTSQAIKLFYRNLVGATEKEIISKEKYYIKYNKEDIIRVFYCPLYPRLAYLERMGILSYIIISLLIISLIVYLECK